MPISRRFPTDLQAKWLEPAASSPTRTATSLGLGLPVVSNTFNPPPPTPVSLECMLSHLHVKRWRVPIPKRISIDFVHVAMGGVKRSNSRSSTPRAHYKLYAIPTLINKASVSLLFSSTGKEDLNTTNEHAFSWVVRTLEKASPLWVCVFG